MIKRVSRSPRARRDARLDAEVRVGSDAGTGETVVLRLHGELANHAQSVVLPLLLPDAPVVVWWPEGAPADPAKDPLGALAQRRITDTYSAELPLDELAVRAATYSPGDTDLAWTRITPWRSMLAAALDQQPAEVIGATVEGESDNPSCELLAMWLADRLGVPVERTLSGGPDSPRSGWRRRTASSSWTGPTARSPRSPCRTSRTARWRSSAVRPPSCWRRSCSRLDPDNTYASAVKFGVDRLHAGGEVTAAPVASAEEKAAARATEAKAPAAKKAPAKKAASK